MPITESRSPSHRTLAGAAIGDSRRSHRGDGGHIVRSPGKGGGPVSVKRPDNNVVVGEPRNPVETDRR
jgi:hypothetical protein